MARLIALIPLLGSLSAGEPELPGSYEAVAALSYRPSISEEGFIALPSRAELVIPERVQVIRGNSGNHGLVLKFDSRVCRYRGGSRFASPLGSRPIDLREVEKGAAYHFTGCEDEEGEPLSLRANDPIPARDSVRVRIEGGDPFEATQVRVVIRPAI